jgi:hypothetical protein
MRRTAMGLLCVAVVLAWCSAVGSEAGRTMDFPQYGCKLTLPGPGYQWLDHTQVPHAAALFADASGTVRVLMLVLENEDGAPINERFVKEFDRGFTESGDASKISGRIGRFRSVPCYQMHARLRQLSSPVTIRTFAANGCIFQLQVINSDLPIDQRGKLEPLFSAFEFTREPELPEPKADVAETELARLVAKYKFIVLIGAGAIAVAIVLISDAARRRKRRYYSGR